MGTKKGLRITEDLFGTTKLIVLYLANIDLFTGSTFKQHPQYHHIESILSEFYF